MADTPAGSSEGTMDSKKETEAANNEVTPAEETTETKSCSCCGDKKKDN